ERQQVQKERFVVPGPSVPQEAPLGSPAVTEGRAAVQGPLPVGAPVERLGQRHQLALLRVLGGEVAGCREGTGQQESRIDRGELAAPGSASGAHVEKVIVEATMAGG